MGEVLTTSGTDVLFALAFRGIPFGVAAVLMDSLPWARRITSALVTLGFFCGFALAVPFPIETWASIAALNAYFLFVSTGAWALCRSRVRLPSTLVHVVSALLAIAVPASFTAGLARTFSLVLGFEFMFSLASYVESAKGRRADRGLPDALLFLVVNPVLVYADRGTRPQIPPSLWRVGLRVTAGALTLYAHHVAIALLPSAGGQYQLALLRRGGASSTALAFGLTWVQLVAWYLAHSGTASLQISGMGALGWVIPERYRFPFLARTPDDFWRRWNTYLGKWLYTYVFVPAGVALLRTRSTHRGNSLMKGCAVLLTFVICGLAHEYAKFVEFGRFGGGPMAGFVLGGVVFVIWAAVSRAWTLAARRLGTAQRTIVERAATLVSRAAMACLLSLLGMAFLPGLGGVRIADQYHAIVGRN